MGKEGTEVREGLLPSLKLPLPHDLVSLSHLSHPVCPAGDTEGLPLAHFCLHQVWLTTYPSALNTLFLDKCKLVGANLKNDTATVLQSSCKGPVQLFILGVGGLGTTHHREHPFCRDIPSSDNWPLKLQSRDHCRSVSLFRAPALSYLSSSPDALILSFLVLSSDLKKERNKGGSQSMEKRSSKFRSLLQFLLEGLEGFS